MSNGDLEEWLDAAFKNFFPLSLSIRFSEFPAGQFAPGVYINIPQPDGIIQTCGGQHAPPFDKNYTGNAVLVTVEYAGQFS